MITFGSTWVGLYFLPVGLQYSSARCDSISVNEEGGSACSTYTNLPALVHIMMKKVEQQKWRRGAKKVVFLAQIEW